MSRFDDTDPDSIRFVAEVRRIGKSATTKLPYAFAVDSNGAEHYLNARIWIDRDINLSVGDSVELFGRPDKFRDGLFIFHMKKLDKADKSARPAANDKPDMRLASSHFADR